MTPYHSHRNRSFSPWGLARSRFFSRANGFAFLIFFAGSSSECRVPWAQSFILLSSSRTLELVLSSPLVYLPSVCQYPPCSRLQTQLCTWVADSYILLPSPPGSLASACLSDPLLPISLLASVTFMSFPEPVNIFPTQSLCTSCSFCLEIGSPSTHLTTSLFT